MCSPQKIMDKLIKFLLFFFARCCECKNGKNNIYRTKIFIDTVRSQISLKIYNFFFNNFTPSIVNAFRALIRLLESFFLFQAKMQWYTTQVLISLPRFDKEKKKRFRPFVRFSATLYNGLCSHFYWFCWSFFIKFFQVFTVDFLLPYHQQFPCLLYLPI